MSSSEMLIWNIVQDIAAIVLYESADGRVLIEKMLSRARGSKFKMILFLLNIWAKYRV